MAYALECHLRWYYTTGLYWRSRKWRNSHGTLLAFEKMKEFSGEIILLSTARSGIPNTVTFENKIYQEFYNIGFKKTWCNGENFNNQPMFSSNETSNVYFRTDYNDFHIYYRKIFLLTLIWVGFHQASMSDQFLSL